MPSVACLLLQKNEQSLLEPWILYHAALFGMENLYVFDNGSDDATVAATLEKYSARGLFVDNTYSKSSDYPSKGDILSKKISELEAGEQSYDIYLPLDCDEFVALESGGQVTFCRRKIHEYLATIMTQPAIFHVVINYANILGHPHHFRRWGYNKVFFPKGYIRPLDHGSHLAETHVEDVIDVDIVFVHCHYKPFGVLLEHSREKLAPFVDVDSLSDLNRMIAERGIGNHLVRYLTMTEQQYLAEFTTDGATHLPDFERVLLALGADATFLKGLHATENNAVHTKASPTESFDLALGCGAFTLKQTSPARVGSPATLVIATQCRIAASLVRIALNGAGVDSPGSTDATLWSDDALILAMEAADLVRLRRIVAERDRGAQIWAAYLPSAILPDTEQLGVLRRPSAIFALRNPVDASHRPGLPSPIISRDRLLKAVDDYHRVMRTAISSEIPTLVLDVDRAATNLDAFLDALYAFCGFWPTPRARADTLLALREFIIALNLPAARIYEGWIDHVSCGVVSGWCRNLRSSVPITLELLINGEKVASTVASVHREDLKQFGVGTGRYAFAFRLEPAIARACRKLDVVIAGTGFIVRQTETAAKAVADGLIAAPEPDKARLSEV